MDRETFLDIAPKVILHERLGPVHPLFQAAARVAEGSDITPTEEESGTLREVLMDIGFRAYCQTSTR